LRPGRKPGAQPSLPSIIFGAEKWLDYALSGGGFDTNMWGF
jgi:hypothetical protein